MHKTKCHYKMVNGHARCSKWSKKTTPNDSYTTSNIEEDQSEKLPLLQSFSRHGPWESAYVYRVRSRATATAVCDDKNNGEENNEDEHRPQPRSLISGVFDGLHKLRDTEISWEEKENCSKHWQTHSKLGRFICDNLFKHYLLHHKNNNKNIQNNSNAYKLNRAHTV